MCVHKSANQHEAQSYLHLVAAPGLISCCSQDKPAVAAGTSSFLAPFRCSITSSSCKLLLVHNMLAVRPQLVETVCSSCLGLQPTER
jgi:hypothetical protein